VVPKLSKLRVLILLPSRSAPPKTTNHGPTLETVCPSSEDEQTQVIPFSFQQLVAEDNGECFFLQFIWGGTLVPLSMTLMFGWTGEYEQPL